MTIIPSSLSKLRTITVSIIANSPTEATRARKYIKTALHTYKPLLVREMNKTREVYLATIMMRFVEKYIYELNILSHILLHMPIDLLSEYICAKPAKPIAFNTQISKHWVLLNIIEATFTHCLTHEVNEYYKIDDEDFSSPGYIIEFLVHYAISRLVLLLPQNRTR